MFNKNKKNLLAVLAASFVLTFSGGICAFADETADMNPSTAESSLIIEETAEDETENDAVNNSDEADSANGEGEETSNVIIAGNSGKKAQTDAKSSGTDAEGAATDESEENTGVASVEDDAEDTDDGLISLGIFRTTAYCPCYACSEGYGRHTCTGATARSGHTIAVDPRVIPFGSKVLINGVVYTAEDRGGAVRGNHIDIFFDTHAQTWQYGTRAAEVFLLA